MTTQILVQSEKAERLWRVARWAAMLAVPVLLAGLVALPKSFLAVLWYVAIPILPATFFINTALWRGICPLATLNEWGNRLGTQRAMPAGLAGLLAGIGLVLFHLMVPARRFLFNANGPVLVITVAVVAVLALALGSVFVVRSGFCNGLCPVLPVELLYGQAPLVSMARGRCASCVVCTPRACLDLAQSRATLQAIGPSRRSAAWLLTPFGAFVAALPGFIVGYSLTPDGPLSAAPDVYGATLGGSLLSFVAVALVVAALRVDVAVALPAIAALAGGLYYWFAGPAIAKALGVAAWIATPIQVAGIGVVLVWLMIVVRRARSADRRPA